jgi:hypothetical protein
MPFANPVVLAVLFGASVRVAANDIIVADMESVAVCRARKPRKYSSKPSNSTLLSAA